MKIKLKIKRNRRIKEGIDYEKLAKIWSVLASANDWIYIAEIARRSGINQCTVRYYIDKYLYNAVDQQRIGELKIRLIKLKSNINFEGYVKSLELLKELRNKRREPRIQDVLSSIRS